MLIQFKIPKGTSGAYVGIDALSYFPDEDEFTLQKGLKYRVIERGTINHGGMDKAFMVLEVLK